MAATGMGFATPADLCPLLLVAFLGPLNPSGGDVSVFLRREHTALATTAQGTSRTTAFARYSFTGSISGAVGALAAAISVSSRCCRAATVIARTHYYDGLREAYSAEPRSRYKVVIGCR